MTPESLYGLRNKLILRSMIVFSPISPAFTGLPISRSSERAWPSRKSCILLKKIYDKKSISRMFSKLIECVHQYPPLFYIVTSSELR